MSAVFAFSTFGVIDKDVVNAASSVSDLYADYTSVDFVSKNGGQIQFYVSGGNIGVNTDCASNIEILIVTESNSMVGDALTADGSAEFDVSGIVNTDTIYYVVFYYTAEGIDYKQWDIYITKDGSGNIRLVKSQFYEFNVDRCSELWTDAQSLEECLQPQNDVNCDDPAVIAKAQAITAGCTTDWEKSFNIYQYIVTEFSYDYVQIEDNSVVYQDDAAALLRRKIAVCEGFGNTFVSLCRAVGVPAAVSFGIGTTADDAIHGNTIVDDEGPNHAWACVCLGGKWYHVDPTWDMTNAYEGNAYNDGEITWGDETYDYYLLPLEIFSMTHKICDADTIHGIESSGSCGASATYTISRDAVLTVSGSGEMVLPYGVNGFRSVVFEEGSTITAIGEECFVDCDALEQVILPDTVTRIEDKAFVTCEDLRYVYLPEGLQHIGSSAFDYCDELSYIYVPDSVTSIDSYAFDDCPWLIVSVPSRYTNLTDGYYVEPYEVIVRE